MTVLTWQINYFLTYIYRPLIYRLFFIPRYELFKKPPFHFNYYGYKVFYQPKDGLVYHVGSMGGFEKDVINCASEDLKDNSVIIDIGANIGLITLPLARKFQNAVFHCFEPSPYPFKFLQRTIRENHLDNRIKLNKIGLFKKTGKIHFFVHDLKDASGDGIKDTGRAGKSRQISIKVTTLDSYINKNKIHRVDLIKIDIEGSELLALNGAVASIRKFKPRIIFEAWPKNLEAYGLTVKDVYDFFKRIKYRIYSIGGEYLNKSQFYRATKIQGNYQAKPL